MATMMLIHISTYHLEGGESKGVGQDRKRGLIYVCVFVYLYKARKGIFNILLLSRSNICVCVCLRIEIG